MQMIQEKRKRRNLKKEALAGAIPESSVPPRDVLYMRISREDLNVENQSDEFDRKFPHLAGIERVKDVVEGDGDRVNLFKLIRELPRGSTIYSIALDRISRDTKSLLEIVECCEERGVNLFSVRQGDLLKLDRIVLLVLGYVAEQEKKNISLRTIEGIARSRAEHAKKRGSDRKHHWGYGIAQYRGRKDLKPVGRKTNPIYIQAIPDARELKEKGFPYRRIAQILTQMYNFRFSVPNVSRMLTHGHG